MNDEDAVLLPINIGHECEILVHDDVQIRKCQQEAFDSWIRPWRVWSSFSAHSSHSPHQHHRGQYPSSASSSWSEFENAHQHQPSIAEKNVCCYRWSLLDCLTDSVQRHCPYRSTFDLRTFLIKRDEVVLYYETFQCKDYPFGTLECHLSTWALVALILLTILLLLAIGFLAFYNIRLHRNSEGNLKRNNKTEPVTDL